MFGGAMTLLNRLLIKDYKSVRGDYFGEISLSYEIFGKPENLRDRGVLVTHALTGNSKVAGIDGWWSHFVAHGGAIDLDRYTVVAFNIPGNGYTTDDTKFHRHDLLTTKDIARLFALGLQQLSIYKLRAAVGGSLGGLITWELAVEYPEIAQHFVCIGAPHGSTDWVIGQTMIQEELMKNCRSEAVGVKLSRMMSMLFYRTPHSFNKRFEQSWNEEADSYNVESYLRYQAEKLLGRMNPSSYRMMNHLLGSCDLSVGYDHVESALERIRGHLLIVGISSDVLFPIETIRESYELLAVLGKTATYVSVESRFGHDAFLLPNPPLEEALGEVFPRYRSTENIRFIQEVRSQP